MFIRISLVAGLHARSSDPKRGIGQFFISRRKEDI